MSTPGVALIGLLYVVLVAAGFITGLVALWRGMRAQERMVERLEAIERALLGRTPPL